MALKYSRIEIYITEESKHKGRPLTRALVDLVHDLRIAARCMVFKGVEAAYETGEIAAREVLVLSYNMPVRVEIILPEAELDLILPAIEEMVEDGIVAVGEFPVLFHKTWRRMIPRQIRVKDVMTSEVETVSRETTVDRLVELLMDAPFTCLPVIDRDRRVVGVITQGDLIYRADMPLRLGLLAQANPEDYRVVLDKLSGQTAGAIMTSDPVTIGSDKALTQAVDLMLEKQVKRLPVLDENGRLAGVLSRLDIFKTIAREAPKWDAILKRRLPQVGNLCLVADVMARDVPTVGAETFLDELAEYFGAGIRSLPVLDPSGRLIGLVTDGDLLQGLADREEKLWKLLARKIHLAHKDIFAKEKLKGRKVSEVMMTEVVTVSEDTGIDQAIKIMVDHKLKRLPVVDRDGFFKGMVNRDGLLRVGVGGR